jgi:hypothetical protein
MTTASRRTRILARWAFAVFVIDWLWGMLGGDDMSYSDPVRWVVGVPLIALFVGILIAFVRSRRHDRQTV